MRTRNAPVAAPSIRLAASSDTVEHGKRVLHPALRKTEDGALIVEPDDLLGIEWSGRLFEVSRLKARFECFPMTVQAGSLLQASSAPAIGGPQ